jgi:hypothetical protein
MQCRSDQSIDDVLHAFRAIHSCGERPQCQCRRVEQRQQIEKPQVRVSGEGEWIVNPATGDTIEMRITKRFQYSANYQGKLEVPFSLVETMNIKLEKTGVSESKEKQ